MTPDVLDLAGRNPAVQAAAVVVGTFILEDAATVLAAVAGRVGAIWTPLALGSLYVGIVLGDLGLYALGRLSARVPWAHRVVAPAVRRKGEGWLRSRVFTVVFISRFVPGARLPTYLACGFLGADLKAFLTAAVVATLLWTSMLFGVSLAVGEVLMRYLGAWRWAGAVGFAAMVVLLGRMASRWQDARP